MDTETLRAMAFGCLQSFLAGALTNDAGDGNPLSAFGGAPRRAQTLAGRRLRTGWPRGVAAPGLPQTRTCLH
jgi:hypothetical protein